MRGGGVGLPGQVLRVRRVRGRGVDLRLGQPVAVALVPAVERRAVDVGVELQAPRAADPERRAAEAAALEQLRWRSGGGSIASSFQCRAHTGSGTSSSSARRASSSHVTARRGSRRTLPPSAWASTWAPRQMPSTGTSRATASRSSSASASRYG